MKKLLTLIILLPFATACIAQDSTATVNFNDLAMNKINVIGALGKPLGTIVTLKGVLINYFSKRRDSGPNIIVQTINDSAIQSTIQIPVWAFRAIDGERPIDKLNFGDTYLFKGFETGEYVGTPRSVIENMLSSPKEAIYDTVDGKVNVIVPGYLPQSSPYHFQNRLMAIKWEKIDPITPSPAQFVENNALLQGIAVNENGQGIIKHAGWTLILTGHEKWADDIIGKNVEAYGVVRSTTTKNAYKLETTRAGLSNLADMVGQPVKLRGKAISLNGYWWFNYRGTDIYVENMEKLAGWSINNHYRMMEISGMLKQAILPRIDQITLKRHPDKKLCYIVKKASWRPIELLLPEIAYDKYGPK